MDADGLRAQVEAGKNDMELLDWVLKNSKQRSEDEIKAWSYNQRWRRPTPDMAGKFETMRQEISPLNYRIETWFQLLDADEKRFL